MVAEYGRRKQNKYLHIQNLLKVMNWCQLWKTSGHKGPGSRGQCCHFQRIATLRKSYFETRLKWNHMYVWQEKCSWEMIHALLKIKFIFFSFFLNQHSQTPVDPYEFPWSPRRKRVWWWRLQSTHGSPWCDDTRQDRRRMNRGKPPLSGGPLQRSCSPGLTPSHLLQHPCSSILRPIF